MTLANDPLESPMPRATSITMPLAESLLHSNLGFIFIFDINGRLLRWNENLGMLLEKLGFKEGVTVSSLLSLGSSKDLQTEIFSKGTILIEAPWPGGGQDGPERIVAWVLHHILDTKLCIGLGFEEPRRHRVETKLERRLKYQNLVSDLSVRFVNFTAGDFDLEIKKGLEQVGEFFELERCTFAEVHREGKSYKALHSWVKSPLFTPLSQGSHQFMPMLMGRIKGGEPYRFSRREEIPGNWIHEKRFVQTQGIQAGLMVPLRVGGSFLGAFLIDFFTKEYEWPDEMVKELRFVGVIFANAIARRRADEELAGSEKRLRMITNALPLLIAYVGGDRRYRFNNKAYEQWYGIPAEQVHGKTMSEVLGTEVYARCKPYVDEALSGVPVNYRLEIKLGPDNENRFIEARYLPHVSPGGQVLGFYSLVQDVTDWKNVEMELQRQRDELAHVTRVATLGEMSASMVHELNQPLAAILNNAQAAEIFLERDPPDLKEAKEALKDIVSDDLRAGEVIRRLRAYVVKGDVKSEPIQINELVNDVLALVRNDANLHKLKISTELASTLPEVQGDPVQLQQVLINLILNGGQAMNVMPSKGQLVISTSLMNKDEIKVSVTDSGPGIDEEFAERIFDAFFTTKGEGLGMGLSICRSIVNAHGGRIWMESRAEGGSIFSFSLPIRERGANARR
jgi:PAS domain S-box-containing protein